MDDEEGLLLILKILVGACLINFEFVKAFKLIDCIRLVDIFSASELRLSLLIWFRARPALTAIFSFLAFRYLSTS